MTMTAKEIRETAATRAIEVALIRAHPDLSDGALGYLLDAATRTIEWAEAVDTNACDFDVNGCLASCRSSDIGQLIFAAKNTALDGPVDHVQATADMTDQQRITYAREHGLA